jgi:6-pyruvoyltetrahydropterin/6-carboxytetrahydropterin synthase
MSSNFYSEKFESTKIIELGSCAFRQWRATHSHCSKIHGYQLKAKFWFKGNQLDDKNWIVDFGGLKDLKNKLQAQFDHTLCVAKDDPYLEKFEELDKCGVVDLRIMDAVGIEKTAEWCFNIAQNHVHAMTDGRCRVVRVEVFEHEDNSAIYEQEHIDVN